VPNGTSYTPGWRISPEIENSLRPDDVEDRDQGLDVVDRGWLSEEAVGGRKRWLLPWLAPLALDAGEQRRLFAAHVGTGTDSEFDVEAIAETGRARGGDCGS